MTTYTIVAIIIIVLGVAGYVFKKRGEAEGLGGQGMISSRSPHGKLVRTKRLDTLESPRFWTKFSKLFILMEGLTLVVCLLCWSPLLDASQGLPMAIDLILVLGAGMVLLQADEGYSRPLAYCFVGYLIGGALAVIFGISVLSAPLNLDSGGINIVTMLGGSLGSALAGAWMPLLHTYARQFEDGYVNSIKLSERSSACKAFERLEDPQWDPPRDRIQDPSIADNIRALRQGKK